jgi:AraC family transcriptional regulator
MSNPVVPTHGSLLDELRFDAVRVFEASHRPALRIAQHEHDLVKLCIVLNGAYVERSGANVRSLRPRDLFIRPSRWPHINHYGGKGARSLLLELPPDHRIGAALTRMDGCAAVPAGVKRLAIELASAFQNRGRDRAQLTRRAMHSLVTMIIRSCFPRFRPLWLDAIRERLAERFSEPIVLDQLAQFAGVHRVHLSQAFRAHFGQTLTAYVRSLRVFHATELLWSGTDIASTAIACGFYDQSHFTHAFSREHEVAPAQYRVAMVAANGSP